MTKKNLLKGLTLPKTVEYEVVEEDGGNKEYAKIAAYPFERGFGTTIGNSLRRALLSSIQGYAVSSLMFHVRKDGNLTTISNEFEALPGVKEDIVEIIANIKKLALKCSGEDFESQVMTISCKGPGELTGAAFAKNGIEVINSDLHILTMEKDVDMDIDVQIDFGRVYIPADMQKNYVVETYGVIAIDSLFSPVVRVNYSIDAARVGQRNDFEKLVLEVWTNGAISAVNAVGQAAFIVSEYLQKFINFDKSEVLNSQEIEKCENDRIELLKSSIDRLDLNSRSMSCLKRININFIYELVQKNEDELLREKNFGEKSLGEIKEKLQNLGLSLGMTGLEL